MRVDLPRPTELAHEWVAGVVNAGETVIDATAGNGRDTVFLARLVGPRGKVLAFDVQDEAVGMTRMALAHAGCDDGRAQVLLESHEGMAEIVPRGRVSAVMFNLGYLPHGDHRVTTRTEVTLRALDTALGLLRSGGIVTIVAYPGHPGGDEEARAVLAWSASLADEGRRVAVARVHNTAKPAPLLAGVWKRGSAER